MTTVVSNDSHTSRSDTDQDDELLHVFCECSPDVGLCGTPLDEAEAVGSEENATCIVCDDLEFAVCQRCGT